MTDEHDARLVAGLARSIKHSPKLRITLEAAARTSPMMTGAPLNQKNVIDDIFLAFAEIGLIEWTDVGAEMEADGIGVTDISAALDLGGDIGRATITPLGRAVYDAMQPATPDRSA